MKTVSAITVIALALSGAATVAQTSTQGGMPMPPPTQVDAQPATPMPVSPPMPMPPALQPSPMTRLPAMSPPPGSSVATPPQAQAPTPPPIVIDTKVDLTTEPGPPADMQAAREEAVNALQWARTEGCKGDPSPRECVREAQSDYRDTMSQLGHKGGR
jgi:hypothetical protein